MYVSMTRPNRGTVWLHRNWFHPKISWYQGLFFCFFFVATTVSYFQQNWQQETHFRWVTSLRKAHRAIESDIKVNDCSNRGQIVFRTTHDSVPTRSWTHQIRPWASGMFILKESRLSKTEAGFTPQISMAKSDWLALFDFLTWLLTKGTHIWYLQMLKLYLHLRQPAWVKHDLAGKRNKPA